MTNGFGRPTASRIAPRRNPSVAPAPTDGPPVGEGTPSADNEPTLLDDVQEAGKPDTADTAQADAPDTECADAPASAAEQPDTDGKAAAPAPADDDKPPVAPETGQEPQSDTAEPPAAAEAPKDDETGSSDAAPAKPRKPRKPRSAPAPDKTAEVTAPTTNGGTSLVVIGPNGDIAVDDSVHVVDLRTVAAETDPHALVDQLTALSGISDSQVRVDAVAAITEAITKVALAS